MEDVQSFWLEAVVWAHTQPKATKENLAEMIPWKFDHLICTELKRAIERDDTFVLYGDFSNVCWNDK